MVSTLHCRDMVASNLTCYIHTDFDLKSNYHTNIYQILLFSGLWVYMVPEAIPETKLVGGSTFYMYSRNRIVLNVVFSLGLPRNYL